MISPRPADKVPASQGVGMRLTIATCLAAALLCGGAALSQEAGRQPPPASGPDAAPTSVAAAPTGASSAAAATDGKSGVAHGQAVEGVAVLVNDEVISYSDVRNRAQLILLSFGGKVDEDTLKQAQQRAIESLIEEKIQLKEFHKLSTDHDIGDDEIDEELEGIAKQNGVSKEKFVADIVARGINPQTLRDQIKADIAWQNLVRGRFRQQVRVSDLRIDEMMARTKASLDKPQYRLAEIFLYAPDAESRANAKQRATTLQAQIEKGASFEMVAQQFSAAPSASAGGDLGWITDADMRPEIEAAVLKAKPPSFLPPIETDNGVYLIALLGKREPLNPNEAKLTLKQIVAKGDDAVARLQQAKARTKTCADVAKTVADDKSLTAIDLNDVARSGLSDSVRAALMPVQAGGSTDVIDVANGKAVLFVCQRAASGSAMPTRDQVRNKLFETEITMMADRYLRDLKREATIIRR
jgi:peptidyl-prolyl cis-trans isomerase SurA